MCPSSAKVGHAEGGYEECACALSSVACLRGPNPTGKPLDNDDPSQWLPENWPDGWCYLVKQFDPGPGILAQATSTDALTDVMAEYSWTALDGDWM